MITKVIKLYWILFFPIAVLMLLIRISDSNETILCGDAAHCVIEHDWLGRIRNIKKWDNDDPIVHKT